MTLPERDVAVNWVGLPVEDSAGGRVGTCTALYVDEATDRPEWALVGLAGDAGLRFVSLVDAREESGALRVSFGADIIGMAPQVGDQDHLSGDEEAELYRHYGVPFSAGASDTVLPAAVTADQGRDIGTDTAPPLQPEPLPVPEPVLPTPVPEPLQPSPAPAPAPAPTPPRPTPPPPPPSVDAKPAQRIGLSAEAIVAGVAGASAAAVLLRRELRRNDRRGGPLRHRARSVGGALTDVAEVVTGAAQALGSELARTSGQLSEATADAAQSGTRVVTGAAGSGVRATKQAARKGARLATEAAGSGVRAAADAAQTGGRVVTGAAESARGVAVESRRQVRRSRRKARRSWRRTARRAVASLGLGAGYVLGARAGERRYVQLRAAATSLTDRLRAR